ncbi:MAG: hypothetical protein N3E40_05970, partial [Dehalococcoidia bacterium]|nr:hypothetical protein [Dehalococcoidia bacterium]
KHSIKLAQLVSKEFSELRGERALLLVNLVASNEEAADRLAYNIIATGLTLAHDKIPAAIAAYDHQEPRMVTAVLAPSTLVARALQLSQQVSVSEAPVRYLPSASVMGLMASVLRLRQANDGPARKLAEILDIEFRSLWEAARRSPATEALTRAFAGIGRWCNVVVISGRNHDAEALAFSIYELRRRGTRVVEV